MIRTSILLSEPLHQRLLWASKAEGRKFSAYIRELLDQAVAKREKKQLDKMYAAMEELMGIGTSGDPTVSESIDEILYGEHGAWRGSED
jgi:predicted DNA-binding protein